MKLKNLLDFPVAESLENEDVSALITDVRQCFKGALLFRLKRNEKCTERFGKGRPTAVVVPEEADIDEIGGVPILPVPDVRNCWAKAWAKFTSWEKEAFPLIGVTGTNGKTGTATVIRHILQSAGFPCAMIGTGALFLGETNLAPTGYSMTTPDPDRLFPFLSMAKKDGCRFGVMEVSSHALALSKVSPLSFDVSVFTGLSPEHLDFHGDMENYYQAKKRLFSQSKFAVIQTDCTFGKRLATEISHPFVTFGFSEDADYRITSVVTNIDGIRFEFQKSGEKYCVSLPVHGFFQAQNATAAIAVCEQLGIPISESIRFLTKPFCIPGRMEVFRSDITVVLDYAHTPEAMRTVLEESKTFCAAKGKLHCVFGCGGERDRAKRPVMASAAEHVADEITVTSDNPRNESQMRIFRDILSGFEDQSKVRVVTNRKKAIVTAILSANPGNTVLVAGKGIEPYLIDKNGIHPYDERKILLEAIMQRENGHTVYHET